ncbi:hypothetical protein HWQ46_00360 [Shewanella sp. D64]|uniref:hypothetical protein n=1 Tax=unclassified Shewanella TaxID=196818 RepID=UPI0022BA7144|nr:MULTISPECIES: hypothetical protein [unclassified Shewanella]MEC4724004.1 hypothetical protein [Shewanella sp. D64]MEC4736024.1 hypothetical protein [Shewanella sp. E94]WBJ98031.1 hypothetical protein HWQ47_13500 [Shewanella sp. MTB7]WBJ98041.1 hypothetical protein HWQ47_13550 [Shewanella sp. MTB7]
MNKASSLRNKLIIGSAVASTSLMSTSAFALTAAETKAITDAVEAGQVAVALVVAGVIAIAALGFGVSMIVAWLRR